MEVTTSEQEANGKCALIRAYVAAGMPMCSCQIPHSVMESVLLFLSLSAANLSPSLQLIIPLLGHLWDPSTMQALG